jgi:hypothetical protein
MFQFCFGREELKAFYRNNSKDGCVPVAVTTERRTTILYSHLVLLVQIPSLVPFLTAFLFNFGNK